MANFASAFDLTNDSNNRGKVTINLLTATADAANNQTTITWNVVVSDGNTSFGGYNYNSPSGEGAYSTGTITASGGGTLQTGTGLTNSMATGYQSYDFGSGVVSSPYFPRTLGTYTSKITHSTSTGAASVTGSAVLQGNANPLGYASASTGAVALTDFAGPATQAAPTVSRVSGTPTSISIVATAPSSFGSAGLTRYEYDYSTSSFADNNPTANLTSMGTSLTATKTLLTSTQSYYVRTRTVTGNSVATWQTSAWSPTVFIAGVPSAPDAPTISNVVTTSLTLTWTAPADNGATISSYTVQATTNGTTWSNIATGVAGTTTDLSGLTIAATYKFRIIAINSSGSSSFGAESASQFISAYGYRYTSPTTKTAIKTAARYTGVPSDTITVEGNTYTGWKLMPNVLKYQGGAWVPLET